MSYFMQAGDNFFPSPGRDSMLDELPTGNFVVAESMGGLFFQRVQAFEKPGRTYGNLEARAERILRTFLSRDRATGALFAGEQGSGKSLLARIISCRAYEMGIPTILVNSPWVGDKFSTLLASIEQPCVVQMDEFEKVYDHNAQEGVLTLLDGTMTTQKLFLLTVNDKYRVDRHMRNRPGRLFYALDFEGLESEFVREYCEDNLDNKEHIEDVVKVGAIFHAFNFDILKALVEEMNRYEEDVYDALEMLNANPIPDVAASTYDVCVWSKDGTEMKLRDTVQEETPISSGGSSTYIYIYMPDDDDDDDDDPLSLLNGNMVPIYFKSRDLVDMNVEKGSFEFINDEGYRAVYTKKKITEYDLRAL